MTKQDLIPAWQYLEKEKETVYTRFFVPLPQIREDEYHRIKLRIESAYFKLIRNICCNNVVTLDLELRHSEYGYTEFEIYGNWDKFLEEFSLNALELKQILFNKSGTALKKELSDKLIGKEVIGLIAYIKRGEPKLDKTYLLGIKVKDDQIQRLKS